MWDLFCALWIFKICLILPSFAVYTMITPGFVPSFLSMLKQMYSIFCLQFMATILTSNTSYQFCLFQKLFVYYLCLVSSIFVSLTFYIADWTFLNNTARPIHNYYCYLLKAQRMLVLFCSGRGLINIVA